MRNVFVRPLAIVLPIVAASLLLAGCPKSDTSSGDAPYGQTAPPAGGAPASKPPAQGSSEGGKPQTGVAASGPTMPSPPPEVPTGDFAPGGPMAPLTPTPELDKAIAAAEAKKDKKAIAAAYASRGFSRMTDDKAGQRVKYRMALEDFRTALKSDPTNQKAKENKDQIESIYKSMGRPIPGEAEK